MVCKGPNEPDYECKGWLKLRDRIIDRDGFRSRNCGAPNKLEVHHWRPTAEFADVVDERGYAFGNCPLIVPDAGLVTLCSGCHRAMTERRMIGSMEGSPSFVKEVEAKKGKLHNVFELWALNRQLLPFKIVRSRWNSEIDQYYLVEEVQIRKPPYGFA
jgi:hypothetical protein